MKHRMNKTVRIWLVLGTLIVVGILATVRATSIFWFPHHPGPPEGIPGDIEFFYTAKTIVSTINVTLLIILLLTYVSIYTKTHSEFTIGLMVFSMVLLLNVLVSNPLVIWTFGFRPFGLGPFAMLPDLFTCVALAVLLYLSVKY